MLELHRALEYLDDCDSSVMILMMGMMFWRNTVKEQNIEDLKHCKVIIKYLEGFSSETQMMEPKVMIKELPFEEPKMITFTKDVSTLKEETMEDYDDNDLDEDDPLDDEEVDIKNIPIKKTVESDIGTFDDAELDVKNVPIKKTDEDGYVGTFESQPDDYNRIRNKVVCTCDVCGEKFKLFSAAKDHYVSLHPDKLEEFEAKYKTKKCGRSGCDSSFFTLKQLHAHYRRSHKLRKAKRLPFEATCTECDLLFKSRMNYEDHLEEHKHGLGSKLFPCELCGKRFRTRNNVSTHKPNCQIRRERKAQKEEELEMEGSYLCPDCGVECLTKKKLGFHKEKHKREKKIDKPVVCTECNEFFKNSYFYHVHAFRVHNVGGYFCELCSKKFLVKIKFEMHLATHSEKNIQCPKCESKFHGKYQLKRHIDTIHPDKPFKYQCEHCEKGFMLKPAFESHTNIHLGLKPHVCEVCSYAFSDKSNMLAHRRKVHKLSNKTQPEN